MTSPTENSKRRYQAPGLIEFGSVRNLTGGSNVMAMDGTIMMVRNP